MKKIVTNFNTVLDCLRSINYINGGGCGIAALAMYRWLEANKYLTSNTKVVYLYRNYDKGLYDNNKQYIENGDGEINSCNHAVLFHYGNYIDCRGVLDKVVLNDYPFKQLIEEEILVESLNTDTWNSMFNREISIPFIEKMLGVDLSDIL